MPPAYIYICRHEKVNAQRGMRVYVVTSGVVVVAIVFRREMLASSMLPVVLRVSNGVFPAILFPF